MRYISCSIVLLLMLGVVAGCGDDDTPVIPAAPVLKKFVIDFENRPDDGFSPAVTLPDTLAPGVVIPEVLPAVELMDFSTADGWELTNCGASAISGNMMVGGNGDPATIVIEFTPAISKVEIHAGGTHGGDVTIRAFDANGATIGADTHVATCPMLSAADQVSFDVGSNRLVKLQITGAFPVIDDLIYYRFQ